MINSISEVTNSGAPVQELKLRNDIPHKVSFAAGEDKVELSNKEQLPAEAQTDEKKGFNKNWLYGLGALALAIGGYFAFRGKGADDVSKKGSEVLQDALGDAKGEMPKLTPELKYFKKLEANIPTFPKAGEAPIETALKNGGKRVDSFDDALQSNVSRYLDKNGKVHREVTYDTDGSVDMITINNKAGKPLKKIVNNFSTPPFSVQYKYTKDGKISRITSSNDNISDFTYIPHIDGSYVRRKSMYQGGEVLPENKVKTISTIFDKDNKAVKKRVSDYVKNEFITKNIETSKTEIYVPKDGNPLKPGMKLGDELVLSKTIEPFEKDGQKMVKITNAADGKVEEIPFEKYNSEHFFDD